MVKQDQREERTDSITIDVPADSGGVHDAEDSLHEALRELQDHRHDQKTEQLHSAAAEAMRAYFQIQDAINEA